MVMFNVEMKMNDNSFAVKFFLISHIVVMSRTACWLSEILCGNRIFLEDEFKVILG